MKIKASILLLLGVLLAISLFFWRSVSLPNKTFGAETADKKILNGPIVYGITSAGVVFRMDAGTCAICPVMNTMGYSGGALHK